MPGPRDKMTPYMLECYKCKKTHTCPLVSDKQGTAWVIPAGWCFYFDPDKAGVVYTYCPECKPADCEVLP